MRHLEDRRVGILVDRHDLVGPGHACQMLNCARNAAGDVQLGVNGAARLSDLVAAVDPAGVHCRTGRAHHTAEHLCQLFKHREILRSFHAAPAGDDHLRLADVESAADFCDQLPHLRADLILRHCPLKANHLFRCLARKLSTEYARTHRADLWPRV